MAHDGVMPNPMSTLRLNADEDGTVRQTKIQDGDIVSIDVFRGQITVIRYDEHMKWSSEAQPHENAEWIEMTFVKNWCEHDYDQFVSLIAACAKCGVNKYPRHANLLRYEIEGIDDDPVE